LVSDIKGGKQTEGILEQGVKKIFGLKREEVEGGWRKLHNKELHELYSLTSIIGINKLGRMGWAGHVVQMGEKKNMCRLLMGRPRGR
jgi:hypothetical protein